jgi:hypothetical protein
MEVEAIKRLSNNYPIFNRNYTIENFEKPPVKKIIKRAYNRRKLMKSIMRKKMHKLSPKALKS